MKVPMNIDYFVKQEEKTVVAKFRSKAYDLGEFVDNHKSRQDPMIDVGIIPLSDIIGKAVAAPGEEFDVEKGKAIAESRLLAKFYARCQKAIGDQLVAMIACQNELANFERQFGWKARNTKEKTARLAR